MLTYESKAEAQRTHKPPILVAKLRARRSTPSPKLPTRTMKAIVASSPTGPATLTTTRPKPTLRPSYLLIRNQAIAANPADHAYLSYGLAGAGSLLGCDYAGTIEAVGSDVSRDWKVGERVCGCTRAGDPVQIENGTAAEWIVVKADLQVRIPERVKSVDAAGTGVVWLTAGRCLVCRALSSLACSCSNTDHHNSTRPSTYPFPPMRTRSKTVGPSSSTAAAQPWVLHASNSPSSPASPS
jgi:hypothetical protein